MVFFRIRKQDAELEYQVNAVLHGENTAEIANLRIVVVDAVPDGMRRFLRDRRCLTYQLSKSLYNQAHLWCMTLEDICY